MKNVGSMIFLGGMVALLIGTGSPAEGGMVIGGWSSARAYNDQVDDGGTDTLGHVLHVDLALYFPGASVSSTAELTSSYLDGIDVLILGPVYLAGPLSDAEQTALAEFVSNGGKAIISLAHFGFLPITSSFLSPFGLAQFPSFINSGAGFGTIDDHGSYPQITDGPFGTVNTFGGDNLGAILTPTAATVIGTWNDSGLAALAVLPFGEGEIFISGQDEVLWYDAYGDNATLRRNLLAALLTPVPVPEPSSMAMLGSAVIALAVFRRKMPDLLRKRV